MHTWTFMDVENGTRITCHAELTAAFMTFGTNTLGAQDQTVVTATMCEHELHVSWGRGACDPNILLNACEFRSKRKRR